VEHHPDSGPSAVAGDLAFSRHLKLLEAAGVVTRVIDGRTHRLTLRPETSPRRQNGFERQRTRWERLFDVVGEYLEERADRR
jgi:DNA-binding transcriptional ArsR family regulator